MPVVVVIIIVTAWAVILGPSLLKRRSRSGGDQSISHFHYQLRVLEQRAPEPIVTPAYRLRSVDDQGTQKAIHYPDGGRPPVLTVVGAKELPRPALAFLGEPEPDAAPAVVRPMYEDDRTDEFALAPGGDAPGHDRSSAPGPTMVRTPDAFARTQARRRRRDTLTVLAGVFAVTLLAAAVTGSTFVLAVVVLDGVALAAYVAVLVHLRRTATEREMKLHYLDPLAVRPARAVPQRTYMSGRYAHPSNQQAAAR